MKNIKENKDSRYETSLILFSSVLISISLLSGVILASNTTLADDTIEADVAVSVPVSCVMTSNLDSAHSANINAGTYRADIGKTTLNVVCNENSGFSIYAIGYSNEEYGNNKLLATVGGQLAPTYDIVTGTATSGTTSNWAMKLNPVTTGSYVPTIENGYDSYSNVPATYTKVATFNSSTDAVIGASVEATNAAYIASDQPAGTYNGKVKYTMVHPASEVPLQPVDTNPGYISYNPNASGVVDTMGDQSITASDTSANLWASNFKRDGYGFAGWSETFDYPDPTKFHGPNETISFTAGQYSGQNKGLSLYAIWVKSAGSLQDWTGCSSLNVGDVTALTDTRDNETYAVAKLADNKCWMIENLRLDNDHTTSAADIAKAQGYNSSFIGLANPEAADFINSTTANSLYSTDGSTAAPAITGSNQGYRFPRYNNQNTASPATNMTAWGNSANTYSVGNWYTWSAAIADTSNYTTGNQSITATSICPTGWHLPSGGSSANAANSDFWQLGFGIMGFAPANNSLYTSSETNAQGKTGTQAFRSYPNNFIYSGFFGNSSPGRRGSNGYYWSSTVGNGSRSYNLYFDSSLVAPGTDYNDKFSGFSIRCVSGS